MAIQEYGKTENRKIAGLTPVVSVASDIGNPPVQGYFPGATGELMNLLGDPFLAAQIHELANSAAAIASGNRDATYGGDPDDATDPDTGYQMDKCMVNELKGKKK